MKNLFCRYYIALFFGLLALTACDYNPESFPDRIVSDYELAIPIGDTVLSFKNMNIPELPGGVGSIEIPAGFSITDSLSFPFYVSDFTNEDYIVEWVEPKAIIRDAFMSKTDVYVTVFIKSNNGDKYVLTQDKKLMNDNNVLFGDEASRINPKQFGSLSGANRVYVLFKIVAKESIKIADLYNSESHIKLGMKIKLTMDFSL